MAHLNTLYLPDNGRYDGMTYARCGRSGLCLPPISLGIWQNFGADDSEEETRQLILGAFDRGITHFDAANNYGPPPGSAETWFGKILKTDLAPYRDELIISTKAGYRMWPGPYGEWGSRKYLLASLDQSLARLGLDYVDIFYSHRFDPNTPLEETMGALAHAVRSGKAIYAGISNYNPQQTRAAAALLREMGVACLINQSKFNLLDSANADLLPVVKELGMGFMAFSPLAQGLLTQRYLNGIPRDSRAARTHDERLCQRIERELPRVQALEKFARARGQTLTQLALSWLLAQDGLTCVVSGARSLEQFKEQLAVLKMPALNAADLNAIDNIRFGGGPQPSHDLLA